MGKLKIIFAVVLLIVYAFNLYMFEVKHDMASGIDSVLALIMMFECMRGAKEDE